MQPVLARLKQTGVLLADGAMGTMLFKRGLPPGGCPEKINLERPDILEEIARLYLRAGAEIIQTNTFGGSPLKLEPYGLDGQAEEINTRALQSVRNVVRDRAYVSGSCGPSGRLLEPYGDTKPEAVFESFVRQMRALVAGGADIICIETMTDLAEAKLAIEAARSISSDVPICATMTFDSTPRGFYTVMGTNIEQAAKGLAVAGADIIGSNCGNGIQNMITIAEQFRRHSALPIIIQSNAGIPTVVDGILTYPESPDFMAQKSLELLNLGVSIVGGCCGTTPDHIAATKKVVELFKKTRSG